jgi:hypothetical protein
MAIRTLFHSVLRRLRSRGAVAVGGALLLFVTSVGPAAAADPTGFYAGMGTCPVAGSAMQNPNNAVVGCVVARIGGGSFTVGSTLVPIPATAPLTATFGMYWLNGGPTVSFPDGTVTNIFTTVAPTDGRELTSSAFDVPLPGLANFWPGVTSAIVKVELAGPITGFAPLSAGENYPLFVLPLKLHLLNVFLGPDCYLGSSGGPILLHPTAGTTSPPAPNKPVTGDVGTFTFDPDPNGFATAQLGFTGATMVDNAFGTPSANGCGFLGSANWIVNSLFGLPSVAGHNAATFSNVTARLAVDSAISDLTSAINASRR